MVDLSHYGYKLEARAPSLERFENLTEGEVLLLIHLMTFRSSKSIKINGLNKFDVWSSSTLVSPKIETFIEQNNTCMLGIIKPEFGSFKPRHYLHETYVVAIEAPASILPLTLKSMSAYLNKSRAVIDSVRQVLKEEYEYEEYEYEGMRGAFSAMYKDVTPSHLIPIGTPQ
jgi:hypothetical protein